MFFGDSRVIDNTETARIITLEILELVRKRMTYAMKFDEALEISFLIAANFVHNNARMLIDLGIDDIPTDERCKFILTVFEAISQSVISTMHMIFEMLHNKYCSADTHEYTVELIH